MTNKTKHIHTSLARYTVTMKTHRPAFINTEPTFQDEESG